MIQGLSADFASEIKTKQDSLDVTQAHLRAATRELSEQRKQIQVWQGRCSELDQVTQRVRNVERALADEEKFDWTGRTDLDGGDALESAGAAFRWRGQNSTMAGIGALVDVSFNFDAEPMIPAGDSVANLIRLRRLKMWHVRMESLIHQRLESLRGASAEREFQCKKIVALCAGAPVDKVEGVCLFESSFPRIAHVLIRCSMTWWLLWRVRHRLLISGGSPVSCRRLVEHVFASCTMSKCLYPIAGSGRCNLVMSWLGINTTYNGRPTQIVHWQVHQENEGSIPARDRPLVQWTKPSTQTLIHARRPRIMAIPNATRTFLTLAALAAW